MDSQPISVRAKLMPALSFISACLFVLVGSYVLHVFADLVADHELTIDGWRLFVLEHRQWLVLLVLPAVLFGLTGLFAVNAWVRMGLAVLSGLSLGAVFVIVLYVALGVVGPLYEYQPL